MRKHFFGKYPELLALVADMSDDEVWKLNRGGHDPFKVYARTPRRSKHKGQPTVILAKTVKGYGMGEAGEGQMIAHQAKKMTRTPSRPSATASTSRCPTTRSRSCRSSSRPRQPGRRIPEGAARSAGRLPAGAAAASPRRSRCRRSSVRAAAQASERARDLDHDGVRADAEHAHPRQERSASTSCRSCPTSRAPSAWRACSGQLGIYSHVGQLYTPQDADQLMYYREDKNGQVLQEGINEAGAMSLVDRRGHVVQHAQRPMIPFYIYYSMFGFQRVGDLAGAAGDMRCARLPARRHGRPHHAERRGPAARGRPQPRARRDDPELRVLRPDVRLRGRRDHPGRPAPDGTQEQEDVYYYITLMNENYAHPAMPEGAEQGILAACTSSREVRGPAKGARAVQLMGSGTILREVIAAAELLEDDFGVAADVWSVTSFNELRRDGIERERWNLLHPEPPRKSYVERASRDHPGRSSRRPTTCELSPTRSARSCRRPLRRARHRRLRPQRHARSCAVLRGGPPCRRRRAEGARGRRRG